MGVTGDGLLWALLLVERHDVNGNGNGKEANSVLFLGGYRWQLERALHNEMAVVYAVFCGMCAYLLRYDPSKSERGREVSSVDGLMDEVN